MVSKQAPPARGGVGDLERTRRPLIAGSYVDPSVAPGFAPDLYRGNSRHIRFGQPTISPNFSTGQTLRKTIAELVGGKSPDSIGKPIRLVYLDDKYFTLDNRRLYALQQANLNDVPVEIVDRDALVMQMLAKDGRMNPIGG